MQAIEGEVLTPAEEFLRYIEHGVVPSEYAMRRALGDERALVLAAMDQRQVRHPTHSR